MFRWLGFHRLGKSGGPKAAQEPIVSPDQIDLPTPEQRERFAAFINSGNATFGVVDGSREFDVVDTPTAKNPQEPSSSDPA